MKMSSFGDEVLRRMCGLKEVTVEWRRLHVEERHNVYSSRDIVRVMKSRHGRSQECLLILDLETSSSRIILKWVLR
jgi:hypothetical protein